MHDYSKRDIFCECNVRLWNKSHTKKAYLLLLYEVVLENNQCQRRMSRWTDRLRVYLRNWDNVCTTGLFSTYDSKDWIESRLWKKPNKWTLLMCFETWILLNPLCQCDNNTWNCFMFHIVDVDSQNKNLYLVQYHVGLWKINFQSCMSCNRSINRVSPFLTHLRLKSCHFCCFHLVPK